MSENETEQKEPENKVIIDLSIKVMEDGDILTRIAWEPKSGQHLIALLVALGTGQMMPSIYKSIGLAKEMTPQQLALVVNKVNESIEEIKDKIESIEDDEPVIKPSKVFHANMRQSDL